MKVERYYLLAVVLIICCQFDVWAQRDSIRVRVFDGTEPATQPAMRFDENNYISFNTFLIARGAFVVGYEKILHKKHAIALAGGFTFRDFIFEAIELDDFDSDNSKYGLSYYLEAGYKFYPKNYQDFDGGIYISPGFITRDYKMTTDVEYYNGGDYVTRGINTGYNFMDASLKFGYVRESWFLDDVIVDTYFGFGYRSRTINGYEIVDSGSGEELKPIKETEVVPAIYFGAKVGFVF